MIFFVFEKKGKKLFKVGNHLQAFEVYFDAIKQQSKELTSFLTKRAKVEFNLGNFREALLDSAAVLLIEAENKTSRSTYNLSLEKIISEKGDKESLWSLLLT